MDGRKGPKVFSLEKDSGYPEDNSQSLDLLEPSTETSQPSQRSSFPQERSGVFSHLVVASDASVFQQATPSNDLQELCKTLYTGVNNQDNKVQKLERQLREKELEMGRLKDQLVETKKKEYDLQVTLTNDRKKTRQETVSLNKKLQLKNNEIEQYKLRFAESQRANAEEQIVLSKLRNELTDAKQTIKQLETLAAEKDARLSHELQTLVDKVACKEQEISDIEEKFATQLLVKEKEISRMKDELLKVRIELQKAQDEKNEHALNLLALSVDASEHVAEVEKAKRLKAERELEKLKNELSNAKSK